MRFGGFGNHVGVDEIARRTRSRAHRPSIVRDQKAGTSQGRGQKEFGERAGTGGFPLPLLDGDQDGCRAAVLGDDLGHRGRALLDDLGKPRLGGCDGPAGVKIDASGNPIIVSMVMMTIFISRSAFKGKLLLLPIRGKSPVSARLSKDDPAPHLCVYKFHFLDIVDHIERDEPSAEIGGHMRLAREHSVAIAAAR